ncbi:hypothetical protein PPERSA_09410 [Pseudocohnilembus persalinus]|uniref:Uncharacterized protein n=1 Tax=Pseudocohnilembus persalinus TaxID=266149 RepID=A0A0V0Q9M3_PSEPJ|nr:hypothetical protein PPERSA_09410 [Pseudocohnilembus persalinus]|eukprot:KRW98885.1 hypothetical protein PPERSA_09410 [Pseudocohnilembus persalinus]
MKYPVIQQKKIFIYIYKFFIFQRENKRKGKKKIFIELNTINKWEKLKKNNKTQKMIRNSKRLQFTLMNKKQIIVKKAFNYYQHQQKAQKLHKNQILNLRLSCWDKQENKVKGQQKPINLMFIKTKINKLCVKICKYRQNKFYKTFKQKEVNQSNYHNTFNNINFKMLFSDIEQAMKESIQDNINNQINKVNNEKIRQFKIQYPGKHNNLSKTKTQQQNIDLLGDETLNIDKNNQKIQQTGVQMNQEQENCIQNNNQIQNDNNLIDLLGEISLPNDKQQAIYQQQNIQIHPNQEVSKQIQNKINNNDSSNKELEDLFGDMDINQSSEQKKIQKNNTQQKEKEYAKNKQQNQEDDDDFFSSIANRK